MLRFSLGVTRLDRIRNEYIRGTAHVGRLGDKVREARLRWFGHVQRRDKQNNLLFQPLGHSDLKHSLRVCSPGGAWLHFWFSVEDATSISSSAEEISGLEPFFSLSLLLSTWVPPSLPLGVFGPAGLRSSLGPTTRRGRRLALLLGGGCRSALLLGGGCRSALLLGGGRRSVLLLGCGRLLGPSGLTAMPVAPPHLPRRGPRSLHLPRLAPHSPHLPRLVPRSPPPPVPCCLSVFLTPLQVLLDRRLFWDYGERWRLMNIRKSPHEYKKIKDRYVTRIGVTGAPPWSQTWGWGAQASAWWPSLMSPGLGGLPMGPGRAQPKGVK
ncbi:hypothetical protein QTP86_002315 [Hemibagrus guttatus]|nr:hypothetical protein QTP86_002315 [Hemibagrus guttatus]